jgi:CRP-like cAMP-binding protein
MTSKFKYLTELPLFAGLEAEEALQVARAAVRKFYPADQVLCLEGVANDFFGVLTRGLIKAVNHSDTGRVFIIDLHLPGEMVGEFNISSQIEFPCTYVTVEDSEIIFVRRETLEVLARQNTTLAYRIALATTLRLMRLHERMKSLALHRGPQRILNFITDLGQRTGHDTEQGRVVDLCVSQQLLADACGLSRETVSRLLKDLADKGRLFKQPDGWLLSGKTPGKPRGTFHA